MSLAKENVRRLVAWNQRDDLAGSMAAAPTLKNVGIIGAGMMGTAIATAHVAHRMPVVLYDIREEALADAPAAIAAELRDTQVFFASDGIAATSEHATSEHAAKLVRTTADLAEAAQCDLVVESIAELLPAKQQLYRQLQDSLSARTIVVSNTSTIPIRHLADGLADASRFCGMHFFHPVRRRPLVEIIRGPATADRTIAAVAAHVKRLGRMPIVVKDGPGFLVNRLLFPFLGESLEMLREGVPAQTIERAAGEFGMALGPLRLIDEIGLDTTLQAGWVLAAAFPDRIAASPILVSMLKAGRLGQKNGAGFYRYENTAENAADALDPAVDAIVSHWIDPPKKSTVAMSSESIACRLVLPMLLEATRILAEGEVGDARDIDLATLFGLGFPADRGGLLWWADQLGAKRILAMLASHGASDQRWQPTPLLESHAATGKRFY
jgi:3-hydroxyacyl-CoA dehydrogenase/enoyl-CoA hydratase/3-hydroxybutyryl-CoA epimerase/3-hydroxyacyl-CoA dehydrogenase/enoyl-CoA hydratase/3-hydroxybutyryl-CoA epimerase/enoyl-CoA isomerase